MNTVYLNGQFLPQEKATVSVMDRGFLFGDGIYEVIPSFDGMLFGFDDHMTRLDQSLAAISIKNPLSHQEWKTILKKLLTENDKLTGNYNCYCQVTRGAGSTRSHTFSDDLKPTVVAFITQSSSTPFNIAERGFNAITLDDSRRRDCYIKAITLLPNILNMQTAKEKGAIEAILVRNGEVLECTSSNVFMVKNNEILTPALSPHILNGVTRQFVINLAKENGMIVKETKITPELLDSADEIWVTGSSKEICPIVKLNEKSVGTGSVGPIWRKMTALYAEHKEKTMQLQKETQHD